MMLYLYAIVDRGGRSPRVHGIGGADVSLQRLGAVEVAFSALETAPAPTEEGLWQHDAVVEALMRDRAVLPVRFGTLLRDAELPALAWREREFLTALDHVRDKVEFSIRAVWPVDEAPRENGQPAAADLRTRVAVARRASAEFDALHEPLASFAADAVVDASHADRRELAAAYLVPVQRAEAFGALVERLTRDFAGVTLACTGPWAPYSFVSRGDA